MGRICTHYVVGARLHQLTLLIIFASKVKGRPIDVWLSKIKEKYDSKAKV